jgi:curved DNA-binding protein CbpA
MGNNLSLAAGPIPESHVRIYKNVLHIQSPATRIQMLETLLAGQEYVSTAKRTGIYGPILSYIVSVRRGDSAFLPGEKSSEQQRTKPEHGRQSDNQLIRAEGDTSPDKRAISFFSQCLNILGLEEEVALNEKLLKDAYKKASFKAHPDKGGSEAEFDAVTRAYAYLGEILRRVRGGRNEMVNVSEESPARITASREQVSESWKITEPVKLNPKNLNIQAFNKVFEETRLPDPDEDGYGDWLKHAESESGKQGNKFSGKFNRSVFNNAFETEMRSRGVPGNSITVRQPSALTMAPSMGIELGRERPEDYTGANLNGLRYTDLKKAYTTDSTFSHQVSDVKMSNRSYDSLTGERKSNPTPLTSSELEEIAEGERQVSMRQAAQAKRVAEEDKRISEHFQRMQRYVITNH